MNCYFDTWTTPMGMFSLAVADGAVIATAFGDETALRDRLIGAELLRDGARIAQARGQVDEYFEGERRTFTLPLAASGSDFQHRVWAALRAIPYGETRSYGELAREIGSVARAVGRANATNPICVIVPCHRVIGADGSLTGFAFGEELKRRLLEHERAIMGLEHTGSMPRVSELFGGDAGAWIYSAEWAPVPNRS